MTDDLPEWLNMNENTGGSYHDNSINVGFLPGERVEPDDSNVLDTIPKLGDEPAFMEGIDTTVKEPVVNVQTGNTVSNSFGWLFVGGATAVLIGLGFWVNYIFRDQYHAEVPNFPKPTYTPISELVDQISETQIPEPTQQTPLEPLSTPGSDVSQGYIVEPTTTLELLTIPNQETDACLDFYNVLPNAQGENLGYNFTANMTPVEAVHHAYSMLDPWNKAITNEIFDRTTELRGIIECSQNLIGGCDPISPYKNIQLKGEMPPLLAHLDVNNVTIGQLLDVPEIRNIFCRPLSLEQSNLSDQLVFYGGSSQSIAQVANSAFDMAKELFKRTMPGYLMSQAKELAPFVYHNAKASLMSVF